MDSATEAFIEAVRGLYAEHFAESLIGEDEPVAPNDQPMLTTTLVCVAISHLDGETTNVTLYDGSWLEAIGLARAAIYNLLPGE